MEHDNQDAPPRLCSAPCRNPCVAGLAIGSPEPAPLTRRPPSPGYRVSAQQQFLSDESIKMAILLTAQMFSLPRNIVIETMQAALPVMSRLTESNSLLLARLYAGSRQPMPEKLERFYTRLAERPVVRQALLDDYRATYGGMLDPANRVAGQQAGITDGQAREVLAALLPAINYVLGQTDNEGEQGYARRLKAMGA